MVSEKSATPFPKREVSSPSEEAAITLADSLSNLRMHEASYSGTHSQSSSETTHELPTEHPALGSSLPPQDALDSDSETKPFGDSDPLFDEHADSEDEAWVRAELLGGVEEGQQNESVSCPSCFALLSMQVQVHERYEGQFRAIFVTNCKVVRGEGLKVVTDGRGKKAKEGEVYRPVACSKCGTEVGVLDKDDIYHFCNVVY